MCRPINEKDLAEKTSTAEDSSIQNTDLINFDTVQVKTDLVASVVSSHFCIVKFNLRIPALN